MTTCHPLQHAYKHSLSQFIAIFALSSQSDSSLNIRQLTVIALYFVLPVILLYSKVYQDKRTIIKELYKR